MQLIVIYFIVLGFINYAKCELKLQIIKNIDDIYTPTNLVVEEKIGTDFALQCVLVSSENDNTHFDDQISWGKETTDFRFKNESDLAQWAATNPAKIQSFLKPSDVNKGVKKFSPLRLSDGGRYFCMSLKHNLFKIVQLFVKNDQPRKHNVTIPFFTDFCNSNMFKCRFSFVCIPKHYVCDGKPDCKDHSDEQWDICNGDPCKDKLLCEDGRCIPFDWCCDRHHDLNCNVTNRPTCCQLLSEPYEEMEYGYVPYNIKQVKSNGARYLFISVCVLSSFFSVVLLLMILSKVLIFAKKSAYVQARNNHFNLEEISMHQRTHLTRNDPLNYRRNFPCDVRTYRNFTRGTRPNTNSSENCEISNPLLVPFRLGRTRILDQPPAYSEVVRGVSDPPPPYTSREVLNNAEST